MKNIYCPTKEKMVRISRTMLSVVSLNEPTIKIPARIKCSDNDYSCDYDNCPIKSESKDK